MEPIQQQAERVRRLKLDAAAAAEHAKALDRVFREEQQKLWDRMEAERTDSLRVDGVLYTRSGTEYGVVQDQAAFERWAHETGREDLFEAKPRKGLINEIVRECLNDGTPLPPGLGFYVKQYVSQRGGSTEAEAVID